MDEGPTAEELALESDFVDDLEPALLALYEFAIENGLPNQVGESRESVVRWILTLLGSATGLRRELRQILEDYIEQAFNVGGQLALEAIGADDELFSLTNDRIRADIRERADDLTRTTTDISLLRTTAVDLAIQIEQFDEDDSNDEIAAALLLYAGGRALTRSILISQNESVTSSRKAIVETYRRNGIDEKIFRTQRDDRVCPICRPLEGNRYAVDEGPKIPADTHIGCRCFYWPVFPQGFTLPDNIWTGA